MAHREPPPPSDTTVGLRHAAASVASSPVMGTTVPIGVAVLWAINLISGATDKLDEVNAGQQELKIQMVEVSSSVKRNAAELDKRGDWMDGVGADVTTLKNELAMIRRDIDDMKAKAAAIETRLATLEAKR